MNEREAFEEEWGDASVLEREAWEIWQAATLVERERAAKVCEGLQVNKSPDYYPGQAFDGACRTCAAAIRKGKSQATIEGAVALSKQWQRAKERHPLEQAQPLTEQASKVSDFPSVIAAKKVAEKQLEYYQSMMAAT